MSPPNGFPNDSVGNENHQHKSPPTAVLLTADAPARLTPEQIKQFVVRLEIPFDPSVVEWRVTNTAKAMRNGILRGQVIPFADQRAYTDRLNVLFSPAGWTRKYTVHTSANFQRSKDQKTVAKVFVTCDLTIFGIGSHSATGEEWTDDDNAGTRAEAQAFKRACSCFGLGRYLYHFTGTWVDLDDRRRPKTRPKLAAWATPEGWCQGLGPPDRAHREASKPATGAANRKGNQSPQSAAIQNHEHANLVRQIEAMAEPLGRGLYRGLLKSVAQVWEPRQVQNAAVLEKLVAHMQAAGRGLRRLEAALDKTGGEPLAGILHSLNVKSLEQVDNLDTLLKIVLAVEAAQHP